MGRSVTSDALVGLLVDGRYRVDSRIARGGMATVYEATDLRLDRVVALKVLPPELADDDAITRRFVREARAAAHLSSPNIVNVYDQGDDGAVVFQVMEYVAGRTTLRTVIRDSAPIPPARALAIFEEIVKAITVAHEAGIVHRDIKPENVLVTPAGQVKVADFGLARAVTAATAATATGSVLMGTVAYLPPELVTEGIADARSDVYALGVLLFELLTGTKPHAGDSPIQVAYKHVHVDVPAPSTIVLGLPSYLDALVARATARQRDVRPADAGVLLRQLRRVRQALDSGVHDDEELTADLTPTLAVSAPHLRTGSTTFTRDLPEPRSADSDEVFDLAAYDDFGAGTRQHAGPDFRTSDLEHTTRVPDAPPGRAADTVGPARLAGASRATAAQLPRRRKTSGWIALIVVLLLAAAAALGGWYYGVGRFQQTPNLIGLSQARARAAVEHAGLTLRVSTSAYSEQVPAGHIVSTHPTAGANVVKSGVVIAVLSKGPERHAVPDLSGLTRAAAVRSLQTHSLDAGKVRHVWNQRQAPGSVLSFAPKAGTELRRNDPVSMVVSKGPRPIPVKDFTGSTASAAEQAFRQHGLAVKRRERYDDQVPAGDVIAQRPSSGTLYAGDTMTLVVSRGPHLVTVPDVQRYGVADAQAALEKAGFTVKVEQYQTYFGLDFVVSQSPGAGTSAPFGSRVVISIV